MGNKQQVKRVTNQHLCKKIDDLAGEVKVLTRVIMGDRKDIDDSGLIGRVEKNTTFRRVMVKWVWILVTALTLALIGLGVTLAQVLMNGVG